MTPFLIIAASVLAQEPALKVKVGDIAPTFTLAGAKGKEVKLSDFRGRVVIVDFWATWCGWCQVAMPDLNKLATRRKVAVLSPYLFDDKTPYDAWIKADAAKYSFPAGKDKPQSFAKRDYGVYGLPTTLVIDREGRIAETFVGYSKDESRLEAALDKLSP